MDNKGHVMHGGGVEHHELELSGWPLVVGIGSLLVPFAFMAHFSWHQTFAAIFLAGLAFLVLLIGLFGWTSQIYSKELDVGLSKVAIIIFICSEVALFGGLFGGYIYNMVPMETWPPITTPEGVPPLGLALILTVLLLSSSVTIHRAEKWLEKDEIGSFTAWLFFTLILGTLFLLGQAREWYHLIKEGFTISTDEYGTFFYLITGFHGSHVLVGVVLQLFILLLVFSGKIEREKSTIVKATGYYWHFVDVVWLLVLSLIYIIPYRG